jgi:hypothetical protein
METLKFRIDNNEVVSTFVNGVKSEIHKGNNGQPFIYENGKEIYFTSLEKINLDKFLNQI